MPACMTWECFAAAQGVAYSGFVWEPYVRTRTISYVFQAQHGETNMAVISPDLLMDAVLAYQQTAAIKAALELDLFTEIAKGSTTAESLAGRPERRFVASAYFAITSQSVAFSKSRVANSNSHHLRPRSWTGAAHRGWAMWLSIWPHPK